MMTMQQCAECGSECEYHAEQLCMSQDHRAAQCQVQMVLVRYGSLVNAKKLLGSCIAKLSPRSSSSWAEFSFIFSFSPPTPTHPPTRASSEIAGNEQNLLFNIGRSTLVEYKSILKILKKWKTTSMEDDLSGRQLQ